MNAHLGQGKGSLTLAALLRQLFFVGWPSSRLNVSSSHCRIDWGPWSYGPGDVIIEKSEQQVSFDGRCGLFSN